MRILLYKNTSSLFGKLIRIKTMSIYSHAELLFGDGQRFAVESGIKSRFYYADAGTWNPNEWDCFVVPTTYEQEVAIRKFCEGEGGTDYDWRGIVFCQIFPWGWQHKTRWFCSEQVVAAFQSVGLLQGPKPHFVSPGKLGKMLQGMGLQKVMPG